MLQLLELKVCQCVLNVPLLKSSSADEYELTEDVQSTVLKAFHVIDAQINAYKQF